MKNSQNFSIQDAMQLASSPTGQQLLGYLQDTKPNQLKQAMEQAASGQHQALAKTLAQLLQSPEAQEMVKKLGGKHG